MKVFRRFEILCSHFPVWLCSLLAGFSNVHPALLTSYPVQWFWENVKDWVKSVLYIYKIGVYR
jgi:hypothetical protein